MSDGGATALWLLGGRSRGGWGTKARSPKRLPEPRPRAAREARPCKTSSPHITASAWRQPASFLPTSPPAPPEGAQSHKWTPPGSLQKSGTCAQLTGQSQQPTQRLEGPQRKARPSLRREPSADGFKRSSGAGSTPAA